MQVVAACGDGAAVARRSRHAQGRAGRAVPRDRRRPTRRTTSAASTTATGRSTASRPDSTTETYAALRLEIENWRWAGVPFFIRTGKRLPVTQTELRLVFKHPPQLGFAARRAAGAEPARRQARPDHRVPAPRRRPPRRRRRARGPIELDMEFAEQGGEGADAVRGAAPRGARRRQHPLHAAGRRRGGVADHAAAARQPAAGASVRAGLLGAGGGRRARRRLRRGTGPGSTSMSMDALRRRSSSAPARAAARSPGTSRPSGKRILLLERGDWLPREPQNWLAHDVFVDNRYVSPDTWYDAQRQGVPAAGPLLRRRRDEALRRGALPPAQGGLRRAPPPRRHLARLADLLRRARAVLHAGRAALRGARRPRRGPDRAAGERAVPVPGRLARAADPAALRRPRDGRATTRSTRRAASGSTRRTCRTAPACAA